MNEAEYVLRLILRARDELSSKLAKVRTELQGLDKDAKGAETSFDSLNKRITSANTRIGNLTDKIKEARSAFGDFGKSEEAAAKNTDKLTASVEKEAKAVKEQADAHQAAADKARLLQEEFSHLEVRAKQGGADRRAIADEYKRIGDELDKLRRKTEPGSEESFGLGKVVRLVRASHEQILAEDSAAAAKRITVQKQTEEAQQASAKAAADEQVKIEKDAGALRVEAAKSWTKDVQATVKEGEKNTTRIVEAEAADRARALKNLIDSQQGNSRQWNEERVADHKAALKGIETADKEHAGKVADALKDLRNAVDAEVARGERLTSQIVKSESADRDRFVSNLIDSQMDKTRQWNAERVAEHETAAKAIADSEKKYDSILSDLRNAVEQDETRRAREREQWTAAEIRQRTQRLASVDREAEAEQRANSRQQDGIQRTIDKHNDLWDKIDTTRAAYDRLNGEIGSNTKISSDQRRELQRIGSEFQQFSNKMALGSESMRQFGHEAEHIQNRLASFKEADDAGNSVQRFGRRLEDIANKASNAGASVASFDNNLRGMALLTVIGFAQQFLTIVIGLVGGLANLAGSAAMAGAAIGGAFAAGIAQALPVLGILAAAMMRVKAVMDAVNQAQLVQQQKFQRKAKADQADASNANAIANAQDSITNALEGVADARRRVADASRAVGDAERREEESVQRLREARQKGRRELEDLILAEKRAELQAKGAVLSQADAQEAFRRTISEGGSLSDFNRGQLDVASSALDVTEAARNARRQAADTGRATAGGVEGLDTVRQARQGVDDARRGVQDAIRSVSDAERAVGRAERSVDRARRGLENAQATAAKGTSDVFAGAEKLEFMLKKLSPAERRLFEEFNTFVDRWRVQSGKIVEPLIDSFTKATHRVNQLLLDPDMIAAGKKLSGELAKSFDQIFAELTKPENIKLFQKFMDEAGKNLGPLTDIALKLGDLFLHIADAAGPSLTKLIGWVDDTVTKLDDLARNSDLTTFFDVATTHALAWLDLGSAVVELFGALISGGAADEGLTSVKDLTGLIRHATDSIHHNAKGVRDFFHSSRLIMNDVIDVVIAIGKELLKTFNPETAHHFAEFMIKIFIPAVGDAIRFIGRILDFIVQAAAIPGVGEMIRLLVSFLLIAKVSSGVLGLFGGLLGIFGKMTKGVGWIGTVLSGLSVMIGKIPGLGRLAAVLERVGAAGKRTATGAAETGTQKFARLQAGGAAPTGARGALGRLGRGAGVAGVGLAVGGQIAGEAIGGTAGSAVKGAATGAGIGLMFGPEGAAAGAIIGGGIGLLQGLHADSEKKKADAVKDLAKQLDAVTKKRDLSGVKKVADDAKSLADEARRFGDEDLAKQYDAVAASAKGAASEVGKWVRIQETLGDDKHRVKASDIVDPQAVNEFNDNLTRMKTMSFTSIRDIRDNMAFNVGKIGEGLKEGSHSWQNSLITNFGAGIDAVKRGMADGTISTTAGMKEIHRITRQQMAFARDNMSTMSEDGKNRLANNYRLAQEAIREQMKAGVLSTRDGMKEIRALMAAELETYGLSPEQAARLARNRTSKNKRDVNQFGQNDSASSSGGNAEGGWLGNRGQRGWDTMRHRVGGAAAAAGEAVLNFAHIPVVNDALQGQFGFNLDQMFERTRGFHRGGRGQGGFAAGGAIDVKGSKPGFAVFMQLFRQLFGDKLYVLSGIRPGSRVSGTGVLSNHSAGNAIDISWPGVDQASPSNPPENINAGGAHRMDRLHAYIASHIHKPPILDFLWRTTTGGNHFNHIHLGLAETVTRTLSAARNYIKTLGRDVGDVTAGGVADPSKAGIKRVVAKGPESPFRAIRQEALDAVRRAATANLRETIDTFGQPIPDGTTATADTKVPANVGDTGGIKDEHSWAVALLRAMNIDRSAGAVQAMTRWAKAEGGHFVNDAKFNPLNTTYKGSLKGVGNTGTQGNISVYKDWAQGITATINTLKGYPGIIAALKAGNYAQFRNAVYSSPWGTHTGLARGGVVPALLHAGEHVWTAAEVARAGGHGVMRAMRSMLGGGGQSTGGSFADGGAVGGTAAQQLLAGALPITTELDTARVRATYLGVFKLGQRALTDFSDVMREANNFLRAIRVLGQTASKRVANLARRLVGLAGDVSKDDVGEFRAISRAINRIRRGGVTGKEKDRLKKLRERMLKITPARDDDEAKAIFAEMDRLDEIVKIRGQIATLRKRTRGKRDAGRISTLKNKLTALEGPDRSRFVGDIDELTKEGGVLTKMDDARGRAATRAAQSLAFATYGVQTATGVLAGGGFRDAITTPEAGTAGATNLARIAAVNAGANLGRIQQQEGITGTALSKVQSRMAALRKGGVSKKEAVEYAQLTAQLGTLQTQFSNIKDAHAQGLADLYNAQQAYIQAVKDAAQKIVTDINESARRQTFDAELMGRQATVTGDRGLAFAATAAKRNVIGSQIGQLEQASIAISEAFGADSNEYRAIVEQVADLRMQIAESLRQDLLDRIADVEAATERDNARLGRASRIADVVARFGVGGTGAANPILAARQRISIAQQQGGVLQNERNQLAGLMQTAAAQGNWDVYRDLGDKIAELDTAIVENTAVQREAVTSLRQAHIDLINQRAQFRGGVFSGLGGILQTLGAITGQPDIGRQRDLLNLTGGTLQRQGRGLRDQLKDFGIDLSGLSGTAFVDAVSKLNFDQIETNMSEPDRQQFEALINTIIENEGATQQNTQALKELNDPSNVQSFSSSAWRMFRAAIFTGTGGVIPGFSNIPSFQGGGVMPHDGIARLHAGERVIAVGHDGGTIMNTYITSPTEVADPDYFASRLDWNLRGRGRR